MACLTMNPYYTGGIINKVNIFNAIHLENYAQGKNNNHMDAALDFDSSISEEWFCLLNLLLPLQNYEIKIYV